MCGIVGIATVRGRRPASGRAGLERQRDALIRRGPDGAGLWDGGHVLLAHRRLVVIDPTPAGGQPMRSPGGAAIVYNGELYNDAELRAGLASRGVTFESRCDAETALLALEEGGVKGLAAFRGMYALAFLEAGGGRLLLARDPLGIKPLYYRIDGASEVSFASEIPALLAGQHAPVRPDLVTVSAYLTTIRTVLGERTLFDGIRCVRPGEWVRFDLTGDDIRVERGTIPWPKPGDAGVRETVVDSVRRHLRSDVPICCLLSGGLDSSIVASIARRELGELFTYCSGALGAESGDDFAFARQVAAALGTRHAEAPVTRQRFAEQWPAMIEALGVPLSTPNEVAIHEVARRLRADGKVVTLSGEGADELFAGYEAPMQAAAGFEQARGAVHPGRFQLVSNAWVAPDAKADLLASPALKAIEQDHALLSHYETQFDALAAGAPGDSPLQAHLRFHRRVNLAGLLQRLDTATMLAGVEGRTPFADVQVAALAESLPMGEKFGHENGAPMTKRALRAAFASDLPAEVVARPKASFPLPFQEWAADHAVALRESALARELFTPAAIEVVGARASELWRLSWPMINVALWGRRWWGR